MNAPDEFDAMAEACIVNHDKIVPYEVYTDYMHENRTISDALWDKLDSSPIVVALDQDYTESHDLDPSIPFPWDQSKGLYHLKAFHHIHCLVCYFSLDVE